MARFLTALAFTVLAWCTFIDQPTAQTAVPPAVKPKWLSDAERQRLEKNFETGKSLDVFVVLSADNTTERPRVIAATALMVKVMLHSLFYPVDLTVTVHPSDDQPFYAALAEFERRAGMKVDGVFTLAEFEELSYYAALADQFNTSTRPLHGKIISHQPGYIHAEGTWVSHGDRLAHPINSTDIDCWRESNNCIVADAHVSGVSKEVHQGSYLSVDTSYWDITSWSETRVVAEHTAICRRNVLTVDVTANQAFQVQTDTTAKDCDKMIGTLNAPRMTTLEDGFKVGMAHYDAMQEQLRKVSKFPFQQFQQFETLSHKQ